MGERDCRKETFSRNAYRPAADQQCLRYTIIIIISPSDSPRFAHMSHAGIDL